MCQVIRKPCKDVHIYIIAQWSRLEKEFSQVYRDCFGGPPYFETYEDEWIVRNVYNKHLGHGCVAVALHGSELVGLSCAEKMTDDAESSPYRYLMERRSDLPFPLETSCYISEVAVVEGMRRRGVGTDLLKVLCNWGLGRGLTHYTARTAAEGSNSLGIFKERLHANILEGEQDVEGAEGEVVTASKKRIYVWGKLDSYL
jgi:GNAT superfamily N-acetyltransferase